MRKSKILEIIEYYPIKLLFYFFQLFPYKKGIESGSKFFQFIFSFLSPLKKIVYKNLEIIKNGIDKELLLKIDNNFESCNILELSEKTIYKNLVRNLGRVFFNLIYYPKIKENEFVNLIKIIGLENVKEVLKMGKGVIIASPHIGNWEVFGCATAIRGIPVNVIVRPLDNKKLDIYIENFRTAKKVRIISKFENPKKFFKPLFNNEVMAMMFDQNALKYGVYIPFYKRPASATQGTARFHLITKSPIMPGYSYYDENGNLFGIFGKPFDFEETFKSISYELKIFLFSFYEYFNKNNREIPIYIFKEYLNFDSETELYYRANKVSEKEYNYLYKKNEELIIKKFDNKFENYNQLNKDEKVYFVTYFIHKYYEPILLKHIDSWMLIHPRWKKQPSDYRYPYS